MKRGKLKVIKNNIVSDDFFVFIIGINYAVIALNTKASEYYRQLNMRDAEISSTMLLSPDDIEAILHAEGVADAEGVFQTEAALMVGGKNETVYARSISERISLARLTGGRMPENARECAVEQELMDMLGLELGDTVILGNSDGSFAPYLLENSLS